ncbi:hypothetical protein KBZ21_40985, partial [Streptomyces sp. A73]|nr:hypothetical protein [Streptomyces sp. A73]
KPDEVTAAILAGQEMGLSPMAALRSMHVINGVAGLSAISLRGYGTWQPLADAQPVREHVSALVAAGYTITSIAAASDTDAA